MTVVEIILTYRRRGITLLNRAGHLIVRAPPGALSAADRAFLAAHKAELLRVLIEQDDATPAPVVPTSTLPTDAPITPTLPPCPLCHGPTHLAAFNAPALLTLLCSDAEACRWALTIADPGDPGRIAEAVAATIERIRPIQPGDAVWLLRPDGGPVNAEPWIIATVEEHDGARVATFEDRPYRTRPLPHCRRAREVSYPPAARAPGLSTYLLWREAHLRATQQEDDE